MNIEMTQQDVDNWRAILDEMPVSPPDPDSETSVVMTWKEYNVMRLALSLAMEKLKESETGKTSDSLETIQLLYDRVTGRLSLKQYQSMID